MSYNDDLNPWLPGRVYVNPAMRALRNGDDQSATSPAKPPHRFSWESRPDGLTGAMRDARRDPAKAAALRKELNDRLEAVRNGTA